MAKKSEIDHLSDRILAKALAEDTTLDDAAEQIGGANIKRALKAARKKVQADTDLGIIAGEGGEGPAWTLDRGE